MQSKKNNDRPKETPVWLKIIKGFFRFFARALVTVLSVIIISGCIIGCVLATVILGMVDDADVIDLDQLELSYTTIIYTRDSETGVYAVPSARPLAVRLKVAASNHSLSGLASTDILTT